MNEIIQNFSTQIQTGNFSFLLLLASFLGGVLASISPCSLGMLPLIIGYVAGYDNDRTPLRTFLQLLSFVIGLSAVLTALGIVCALTGRVFMALGGTYWIILMGSLIMIFGLNLLGIIEIPTPNFIKRMPKQSNSNLFIYPFILGAMFALAATPCSTPILASIMSFASLSSNILYAALLLLLFSLGQGVIIVLAGVFTSVLKNIKGVNQYSGYLIKFSGILLIISSLFIYYKAFSPFLSK